MSNENKKLNYRREIAHLTSLYHTVQTAKDIWTCWTRSSQ